MQPPAPAPLSAAVKMGTFKDGKAHVYAFLGTYHSWLWDSKVGMPSDFYVNGVKVGGVNKNECMFIELPAGTYQFSWRDRLQLPVTIGPAQFSIGENQNVFVALEAETELMPDSMVFGPKGTATAISDAHWHVADRTRDGFSLIQDMKIVLPDNQNGPLPVPQTPR